jgi:hypothetical protein
MFPLIFNGSQIMSEAPRDTGHDMAELFLKALKDLDAIRQALAPPDLYAALSRERYRRALVRGRRHDERYIQSLVDKLIGSVGADEAVRRINARKAKGQVGRPKGFAYLEIDTRLLQLDYALKFEWEHRLPKSDGRQLSQHARLTKIVDLCWDPEMAKKFGVNFGHHTDQISVVKRLSTREGVVWASNDGTRIHVFLRTGRTKEEREIEIRDYCMSSLTWISVPRPEDWEDAHRRRPDLGLLP